jgi:multidrug efflux system outer membrane protein
MKKKWLITCIPLLLASCTMHPDYERPEMEMTENWRTPLNADNAIDIGWWSQFNDPILDRLIDDALAQNQDVKTAIARVDQFQAQLGIAKSKYYPQISGGPTAQREKIPSSVTALPPGVQPIFNVFGLFANASYLVDLWGEVRSGVEASYHDWLASIEARRTVILGVVSSVASSYFQLRQVDQQLLISNQTLKSREDELYLAKIRFELGLTSQIEVEQAISEVEDARVEVENFQIAIAETENLLSVLIGKVSMAIPRGLPLDAISMIPKVPVYLPSEILNQRPDIIAAENKLIAANARIGVAKAKFFPKLTLSGAYGAQSLELNQLFTYPSSFWEYGGTLMEELFTGWRITNDVRYTEAVQREALHQYLGTILTAFQEVNNALVSHKIYLAQVETQKTRVEALSRYLYLSNLRYKEGQIDYLTFLDAERQLFRAQLDYEVSKSNSFQSLVQIYQSLGGAWVLAADDTVLDANNTSD